MKSLQKTEGTFKATQGQELYFQEYNPKKPKATLVVVHGMAEHSGRYENFIRYFYEKDFRVCLFDLRGHGKSGGPRGFVDHFGIYVEDLKKILARVRGRNNAQKIFIIGHSFGGQIAVNFLAKYPKEVEGAVLSSPNLKLAMEVPALKKFLARNLSKVFPKLSLANEINAQYISHDPRVVKKYQEDPLVQHRMTLRLGAETLGNLDTVMNLAEKINTPSLILHGAEDRITSPQGSKEFFQKMKSKDKKLKIYPGLYHEIFNETEKEKVFKDIETWLEPRCY